MKKPKRKTLRNKADKLWSELIRLRNKGKCEICGKRATNPHHIIGRKNLTLRHDPRNGVLLCFYHHTGGNLSAHNDPLWFREWLIKHRRKDYNYLMFKRTKLESKVDYEQRIKLLKSLLAVEKTK